jgi:hypothetical protein
LSNKFRTQRETGIVTKQVEASCSTSPTATTTTTTRPTMFPLPLLLLFIPLTLAQSSPLASSLGFTSTPSTLPFPASSLASNYTATSNNNTAKYIKREWDLYRDRIPFGAEGLQFVVDPVEGSGEDGLVLSVDYPAGSYSHATGGVQFYVRPLPTPSHLTSHKI